MSGRQIATRVGQLRGHRGMGACRRERERFPQATGVGLSSGVRRACNAPASAVGPNGQRRHRTGKRTEVVEVAPAGGEPAVYPRPHRLLTAMIMLVAFVVAGAGTWYLLGR